MSTSYCAKPDKEFTKQIIGLGGESVKKCFQCATCSVACSLSPDAKPFPRKEMIWAQWGLKDKLLGDPDVWLCHRCNDCSVHCPRDAKPGNVLAAIRDYTIHHYSVPRFMGGLFSRAALLPVVLGVPAVLLFIVLKVLGTLDIPEGEVHYGAFFAHVPLQVFFGGFLGLALLAIFAGVSRFWRDMSRHYPQGANGSSIGSSVIGALSDVITHAKFKDCTESRSRYFSHLLILYGFGGLFITTVGVVVSEYVFHYYPLPLLHPLKIFGNLSTIALFAGATWVIVDRASGKRGKETSTTYDWTFIGILYAVIITGIITEIMRYANTTTAAYPTYFVHLVVVFALLIYMPYSRFAHMIYRTVALVHARYSGRDVRAK